MSHGRIPTLAATALLAGLIASVAVAEDERRELVRPSAERDELPVRGVVGASVRDLVEPTPLGGLSGHDGPLRPPSNPLPGIAWTPGGPGSGGGSGDPATGTLSGFSRDVLPGDGACLTAAWDISDDRDYAGGQTDAPGECGGCSGAVIWRRDPATGWIATLLPGLESPHAKNGDAYAVIDGGIAVGNSTLYAADCSTLRNAPVIWEPIGLDAWRVTELPTPEGWGIARSVVEAPRLGLLVVGQSSAAALWRQEAGSWVHVDLGFGGGDAARARGVNEAGVVVGQTRLVPGGDYHPFVLRPLDGDGDGAADTWFQDADGDGANDLMEVLTGGGSYYGARAVNASGTIAGNGSDGASVWDSGAHDRTLLPSGEFTEGTEVADFNGSSHVVGTGSVRGQQGNPDDRAALWQLDGGVWTITDLNEITQLSRFEEIRNAYGINDCGDIVAKGLDRDSNDVTFVLTPVDSPCD